MNIIFRKLMSELFDRKIVRRIREVFDNHEEPVDSKAWADMESRLNPPHTKRHYFILWSTAIAAVIIVGIILLHPSQNTIEWLDGDFEFYKEREKSIANSPMEIDLELSQRRAGSKFEQVERTLTYGQNSDESKIRIPSEIKGKATLTGKGKEKSQKSLIVPSEEKLGKLSPNLRGLTVSDKQKPAFIDVGNKTKSELPLDVISESDIVRDVEQKRKMKLGVTLSSLYNYTSIETRSEFNYSGGFESQISIFRSLNIHTGLVFSKQFFSRPLDSENFFAYKFSSDYFSGEENSISGNNRYKLISLDIPINLNYQYKDLSFSAGFSSFVFLHEELISKTSSPFVLNEYSRGNLNNVTLKDGNVIQFDKKPPFETMYLLSTFNFSVGYHIQFNDNLFVIEPYIKHPLEEITQYGLHLGSLGLQLKYEF